MRWAGYGTPARRRKEGKFTALPHQITVGPLRAAYFALKRNAAPAADG
jgi:RNA-directed DNA polymerase